MKKTMTNRGFTLVELLVVISIIALLLSIFMPALNKVREQAKKVVCSSNLKQQGIAYCAYANSANSTYPVAPAPGFWPFGGLINWYSKTGFATRPNLNDSSTFLPAAQLAIEVGKYLPDGRVAFCPAAQTGKRSFITQEVNWDRPKKLYPDPGQVGQRAWNTYVNYCTWASYGYYIDKKFDSTAWSSGEASTLEMFKRKAAQSIFSRSDTAIISDITLENTGADAYLWTNHKDKSGPSP